MRSLLAFATALSMIGCATDPSESLAGDETADNRYYATTFDAKFYIELGQVEPGDSRATFSLGELSRGDRVAVDLVRDGTEPWSGAVFVYDRVWVNPFDPSSCSSDPFDLRKPPCPIPVYDNRYHGFELYGSPWYGEPGVDENGDEVEPEPNYLPALQPCPSNGCVLRDYAPEGAFRDEFSAGVSIDMTEHNTTELLRLIIMPAADTDEAVIHIDRSDS